MEIAIQVGDRVQVKQDLDELELGWGDLDRRRSAVGTVMRFSLERQGLIAWVNFPYSELMRQRGFMVLYSEIELAEPRETQTDADADAAAAISAM
jgi:hypothetical protein